MPLDISSIYEAAVAREKIASATDCPIELRRMIIFRSEAADLSFLKEGARESAVTLRAPLAASEIRALLGPTTLFLQSPSDRLQSWAL